MVVPVSIAGTTQRALHGAIELRPPNEALAHNNGEQAARAEKADCGRSEFLAAASHDLRQPVHALLLLIEAERHQVPAARTHPLRQQIAQAGHAISRLFNPLHDTHRRGGRCLAPPMPWRPRPGRSTGASCWSTTTRWCAPPCARCWVAVLRSACDATSGCPATWTASRCRSAGAKRGPHEHPDRGRPAPDLPGPGRLVVRDTPRHPGGARLPSAYPPPNRSTTSSARRWLPVPTASFPGPPTRNWYCAWARSGRALDPGQRSRTCRWARPGRLATLDPAPHLPRPRDGWRDRKSHEFQPHRHPP